MQISESEVLSVLNIAGMVLRWTLDRFRKQLPPPQTVELAVPRRSPAILIDQDALWAFSAMFLAFAILVGVLAFVAPRTKV
jgi:hypothetical protein